MKDSTSMAITGIISITMIYSVFLVVNAISHTLQPDGIILSGVIGAITALATGVAVSLKKTKNGG